MQSDDGEYGRGAEAPTQELATAPPAALSGAPAAEDRCAACGSPLAHDQRYCVECGERRGQSRFPPAQPVTEVRSTRTRTVRAPRPSTVSSGTTIVAGIGVLLLAIGLGVLIGYMGKHNTTTRAAAPPPQVITVQGGGGGAAAATSTPTTTPTTVHLTKKAKSKLKAAAAATAPPSAAVQKKATQAAAKVLGNSQNLPPPTSQVGQQCTGSQSGCSGGKFTGNYFGP